MSKMSEFKALDNTPVRHDGLAITRKSIKTRVMISSNSQNKSKNYNGDKENKRLSGSQVLSSTRLFEASYFNRIKEEDSDSKNNFWEASSFKIDALQMGEDTSEENMDSLSSDSCELMESIINHEQKHSTPQTMKFCNKAISSTPNPEISNISRLTKNVFTQTNFTSNVRAQDNWGEKLKSYCIEISDDETHYELSSGKSCLDNTSELTSPSSLLCSSKLTQCNETPVQNKQLVRKLSLRSKTMICSAMEKSKDIPKKILARHKSMEEKRMFSNTFSLMPNPKTPPSYLGKVFHNPFEVDLPDKLSKTIFSPDVFDNVVSPSQDSEDLRWTIEDISSINPVPIDEDFSIPSDDDDPERESKVQQEIDRYFSETHFVLSPDDLPKSTSSIKLVKNNFPTGAVASTPRKVNVNLSRELKSSSTQTTLSLPEILPEELEESLQSYFKNCETDDLNRSQGNLRRKLFFNIGDEPPSPVVRCEMMSSPITKERWNAEYSPLSIVSRERHFTPENRQQDLSSPEMSPVVGELPESRLKNSFMTCKKTLHNFFLGDSGRVKTEKKKAVVNSTVIASDMDSSSQPASQDTGYHTEDSAVSNLHFSTPSRTVM